MIFEKSELSFVILDVLEIRQKNVYLHNSRRNFGALSYRFRADAELETGEKKHRITDGGITYVPPRVDYTRKATVDEMIVVHFEPIDYYTNEIEYFAAGNIELFSKLFREIFDTWSKKEAGYKYKCSALLYEILCECYRQNLKTESTDSKIQKSVDYLHKHYTEKELTVETLAKQSYMSEVYFRKLFKQEYGISPQKYIVNLRIQYAISLISAGYYSLKEVARLSGYTDYKYFSVEFKKKMGISPSQYSYHAV